jgi:glucose/arabinose dehydrogenase
VGRAGYLPEIFTLGHRNVLGLTIHPATGEIWDKRTVRRTAMRSSRGSKGIESR